MIARPNRACPRVLAIAHFAPPVHGMSVATERFVELLDERAPTRRYKITSEHTERSMAHGVVRIWRVARAMAAMLAHRPSSGRIYLSSDAGAGLAFTIALLATARISRCTVFVHHHSYKNLRRRSRLFGAAVRIGGPRATQIVTCSRMAEDFRRAYPSARSVAVVPYDFLIEGSAAGPVSRGGSALVLGHLGNLTEEKGLGRVFETLEATLAADIDAELLLAGPLADEEAKEILRTGLARAGDRARYLGPVYGPARRAFYESIDVFLFPSQYAHESFGIVAGEALACGIPVIAYESGCLCAEGVGPGAVIFDRREPFTPGAVSQLATWASDPQALEVAGQRAREDAARRHDDAWRAACELADRIVALRRRSTASSSTERGAAAGPDGRRPRGSPPSVRG